MRQPRQPMAPPHPPSCPPTHPPAPAGAPPPPLGRSSSSSSSSTAPPPSGQVGQAARLPARIAFGTLFLELAAALAMQVRPAAGAMQVRSAAGEGWASAFLPKCSSPSLKSM